MQISCSISGIVDKIRPKQGIIDILNSDYNIFLDFNIFDENDFKSQVKNFILSCKNKIYISKSIDTDNIDLLIENIKISSKLGCEYIIIGKKTYDTYLELAKTAKENDIIILLQNGYKNLNGHLVRNEFSNSLKLAQTIESLNLELKEQRFGFCLDMGACSICGQDIYEFSQPLKNYIRAVVLRDSNKIYGNSLLTFTNVYNGHSTSDWLGLIRTLRQIDFNNHLIIDLKDTASAFSVILRPQLLKFSKTIIEYIKWQLDIEKNLKTYKSIVLFSAGNMCKNYMKAYGEKYKPLFTCDNNKDLWGSKILGLEIKNPQELKNLDKDCVILICNMYYRDIENQIRDMQITNRIEYFNDEYLPLFYMKN